MTTNENNWKIQNKISYKFKNTDLLKQAFTRRSYTKENSGENNETLEFIGDRVLDFYVTKIIIELYRETKSTELKLKKYKSEGELTNIKQKLVNKKMLAHRIEKLELHEYLLMGNGDIIQNNQNEDSIKEDLFEAILGAIAIDSNWNQEALEKSVIAMLDINCYLENDFPTDDYVGLVQNWNQRVNGEVPQYEFNETNLDMFNVSVAIKTKRGEITYSSSGKSKASARINIAKIIYEDLSKHNELLTMVDELPKDKNLDNAINILQELAQKGYITEPLYSESNVEIYDDNKNPIWEITCVIESENMIVKASAPSKKLAKKRVAYECLSKILKLK